MKSMTMLLGLAGVVLGLLVGGARKANANENFRVYNNTDTELRVQILHATTWERWVEVLDVGEKEPTPVGTETLYDANPFLVSTDAVTGQVYHPAGQTTWKTIPGGGHKIRLSGKAPNLRVDSKRVCIVQRNR